MTATAQFLPEECEDLEWYSPPAAVWDCLTAIMGQLFTGCGTDWGDPDW